MKPQAIRSAPVPNELAKPVSTGTGPGGDQENAQLRSLQYGSAVVGDAFCNRRTELRDPHRAVENGEKMFVYSVSSANCKRTSISSNDRRGRSAAMVAVGRLNVTCEP